MLPSRRELLIGLLLAAAGLAAWWYRLSAPPEPTRVPSAERTPDYIVDDLTALTMDAFGRPQRRLATPRLRHFADDDSSELETPRLVLLDDDAPPWHVRSEWGWVLAAGNEVLLQGAVRAERASAPGIEPLTMTTSALLLLPDDDYAETDRFVEIENGDDWITAVHGMQAWFGEDMRVRFFGRTRALLDRVESSAAPASDSSR
jgi:lipopolysaccharide export system protein LptC